MRIRYVVISNYKKLRWYFVKVRGGIIMVPKYKIGDKVRIKSLDWYNKNKDSNGDIEFEDGWHFTKPMSKFCGKEMIIERISHAVNPPHYMMRDNIFAWTDEMIEGLVEEETKNNNDMEEKETLLGWVKESDTLRLVTHKDYEIKHDGDNFYLVKKKSKYPKTYEECCAVLNIIDNWSIWHGYASVHLKILQKLLICRDAYWKIAGEEMGLGKPWEPDTCQAVYSIGRDLFGGYFILEFPTAEMRDAFYEAFKELIKPLIKPCKELL